MRLRVLAQLGTVRDYDAGSILIEEGSRGGEIFIVLKGRLKAFSIGGGEKSREVTYGVYGEDDFVGEMSLDTGIRSASVITLEPTTCAVVSKDTVKSFIATEPEFAFDLLARVILRARRATASTKSMVLTKAYGRLTELLITEARPMSDGVIALPIKFSHREIASRIGCSREMVSRLMKDLETGDYIGIDSFKRLVILKPLPSRW
jgi:CRP/FNR family transcriptional regulator, cyclic AMP receptor protein